MWRLAAGRPTSVGPFLAAPDTSIFTVKPKLQRGRADKKLKVASGTTRHGFGRARMASTRGSSVRGAASPGHGAAQ